MKCALLAVRSMKLKTVHGTHAGLWGLLGNKTEVEGLYERHANIPDCDLDISG
jgi:hypothetical protein